jgi:hypothetical protein
VPRPGRLILLEASVGLGEGASSDAGCDGPLLAVGEERRVDRRVALEALFVARRGSRSGQRRGMMPVSASIQSAMATLPGLPQTEEPEPDALPVEPDDGTTIPGAPPEPGHVPVVPQRA